MARPLLIDTAERIDIHITLREDELEILDRLRRENRTSRGHVLGALLREREDLNPKEP
jgi:hypothetical protein